MSDTKSSDPRDIAADPVVAKLVQAATGERIAVLSGHVGPSEAGVLRLYATRALDRYWEIQRNDVLHVEPAGGAQVDVFVRASCSVRSVEIDSRTVPAGAAEISTIGATCGRLSQSISRLERFRGRSASLDRYIDELRELYDLLQCKHIHEGPHVHF